MIELRNLIKEDGTTELQFRHLVFDSMDRPSTEGFAHFSATKWQKVPTVREESGRFQT